MRVLKLKPEFPASVPTARQLPDATQPELAGAFSALAQQMLLLGKLAGAMLGAIGVTAMIGTLMICGFSLLSGPARVVEPLSGLTV